MRPYEELGPFRLYPPIPNTPKTGWTLSWEGTWMPGSYADKDAVVLIAGLAIGAPPIEAVELMQRLTERHNRAVPGEEITVRHILAAWDPDRR